MMYLLRSPRVPRVPRVQGTGRSPATGRAAIAVAALVATACVEDPTGWQSVYATSIAPNCTTSACHSAESKAAGLDLHTSNTAFTALTGRACDDDQSPALGYVNVIDPAESYLMIMLGRDGPTGMPPNRMLSRAEREHIEAWIRDGALCD